MPKHDQHDPHIAPIFRRATLERKQQDQRLADIFGTQTVPKVTAETLAIYLDYLKQHLEFPCQLTGIEDRGFLPGRNITDSFLVVKRSMKDAKRRSHPAEIPMPC